ncbi:unnamed protein product [Schistosoma margrebowiei]|uniref:Uncharacterized protein n=1 Tax=Schistosoma margrebowiei TaxID=48269 RepID=A0AA84ZPU1_9TREM|nr:unnamed protein product [Schistosoma margrebowiei]
MYLKETNSEDHMNCVQIHLQAEAIDIHLIKPELYIQNVIHFIEVVNHLQKQKLLFVLSLVMLMLFELVSELMSTLSVAFEIKFGISGKSCVIVSCIDILSS